MWFNEFTAGGRYNFSVRNFDMFAYAEYTYGDMSGGGLSMDYDLEPYDASRPEEGIFTVSIGAESGKTHHMRFGFGARHIWDIGGWKLTPSIGYEIFKHELKMSDHYYPNPGIYLPLLTQNGEYVYGLTAMAEGTTSYITEYYAIPVNQASLYGEEDGWFQVCMSPEDIKLVNDTTGAYGAPHDLGYYDDGVSDVNSLKTESLDYFSYSSNMTPWGVIRGECVIIGGDGPSIVSGTTHIYNTTWSGFYIGLEIEKQLTLSDKLRFYAQFGMPKYSSEGIWPNRDDWQQNPSFLDEGTSGSYSYAFEMEYDLRLSERLQMFLKADTNYYHIGKIGGEIYWAELREINAVYDDDDNPTEIIGYEFITTPAQTTKDNNALKEAVWQSFSLHLGLKYSF